MINLVEYAEWVLDHAKPEIVSVEELTYAKTMHGFKPMMPPIPSAMAFNTLGGFVDYINMDAEGLIAPGTAAIYVQSPFSVQLIGVPDDWGRRPVIAEANCEKTQPETMKMGLEETLIRLKTEFVENQDRAYLLEMLSTWVWEDQTSFTDNGVSQTITYKKGATRVATHEMKNELELTPYCSFVEIQPMDVIYNLRLTKYQDKPIITLTPYKDTNWRLSYIQGVANYMKDNLSEGQKKEILVFA